jgi:hypothetical protein
LRAAAICAPTFGSLDARAAFAQREVQLGYIDEATTIIHEMSGGRHPKDRIWVNVVHAVEGTWGIAGHAMTSEQLGQAIAGG